MSNRKRFAIGLALLTGVAIPVLVGCNFLQYQFCIWNDTSFRLVEVNIVPAGSNSWGSNDLADGAALDAGAEQDIKGFAPGEYWVRAVFDVTDPCGNGFCDKSSMSVDCSEDEVFVYSMGDLPSITTTNLCIDYSEDDSNKCSEIYATAHFEI